MKVIFVDFDGTISAKHDHYDSNFKKVPDEIYRKNVERRIKILAEMCLENDAKVVIESAYKVLINEETLDSEVDWINEILDLMKKYGIKVIGITPDLADFYTPLWKEDEILEYLRRHPEVDSYCVLDDDDRKAMHMKSDLDKVRDHLVEVKDYCEDNPEEEAIQEYHKEEVKRILQKKGIKI